MSTIKTTNITHGSNTGTANMVLASDGGVTFASAVGLFSSYAIICDQKDSATDGGEFAAGDWHTRDLNTEIADPDGIVSISSNQFTLQAGTYLIKWKAPAYDVHRHLTRLYDVTNTANRQYGLAAYADTVNVQNYSEGFARVTPSGATAYAIQHACQSTRATFGFGIATDMEADGDYSDGTTETVSIYTVVEIYKEA